MNNVILFSGWTAASKFPVTRTQPAKPELPRPDRAPVVRCPAFVAVWHTNPFSGKLERLWTTEVSTSLDEDDSRCPCGRRAA